MIQDDQRAEEGLLVSTYLIVGLFNYLEGVRTGALSCTEKDQGPVTLAFANKLEHSLDAFIHLKSLLRLSDCDIFRAEK